MVYEKSLCRCNLAGKSTSCLETPGGNLGTPRRKFTAGVEGQWDFFLLCPPACHQKIFLFPLPLCSPLVWECCRVPWSVLLVLSCPVCQVNLRPLLWARGQWRPGHRARRRARGTTSRLLGRELCGSGQRSSWEWQGSGFISSFTLQVLPFIGTDSWGLNASYPKRVFRLRQG